MVPKKRHQQFEDRTHAPTGQGTLHWLTYGLSWLFRQETAIVVCLLVVGIGAYFANYAIKFSIPHILDRQEKQIDRITQSHEREINDLVKALEDTRAYDRQIFLEILREIQGTRKKIEKAVDDDGNL